MSMCDGQGSSSGCSDRTSACYVITLVSSRHERGIQRVLITLLSLLEMLAAMLSPVAQQQDNLMKIAGVIDLDSRLLTFVPGIVSDKRDAWCQKPDQLWERSITYIICKIVRDLLSHRC